MKAEDYAGTTPELRIEEYFDGRVKAWGLFQDRSGKVRRQFSVDILGEVEGDTLTLTEDFHYQDGEQSRRIWYIRKLDAHTYEGRADDVIGTARGQAFGQALNWQYHLSLPVGEKRYKVHFNDWMFLHEDGVLINRASMSKLGIHLGEVTLFFRKID
ncbi:MAG TPA: DUF3833 domain-containing protein [Gammaproteobacteria bacterium]